MQDREGRLATVVVYPDLNVKTLYCYISHHYTHRGYLCELIERSCRDPSSDVSADLVTSLSNRLDFRDQQPRPSLFFLATVVSQDVHTHHKLTSPLALGHLDACRKDS